MTVDERIVELRAELAAETGRRQQAEVRLADAVRCIASLQSLNVLLRTEVQQLKPVPFRITTPLEVSEDSIQGEVPAL